MSLLTVLVSILSLAAFAGYVWLVVVAFKHSTLWGVLVLFLPPICGTIFAIKNWEKSKRPFLVYAGSSASAFAATVFLVFYVTAPMMAMVNETAKGINANPQAVAQSMNTVLDRMEEVGNLDANETAQLNTMRETLNQEIVPSTDVESEAARLAASTAPTAAPPQPALTKPATNSMSITENLDGTMTEDGYQAVPLDDAEKYVGEIVRVLEIGGRSLTGKLTAIHSRGITLERSFTTGTFAIEVAGGDVKELQIYTR